MPSRRRVTVTLTELEAVMLSRVAGNGWGDGDFAEWINHAGQTRCCIKAMAKLDRALQDARENQDHLGRPRRPVPAT